VAAVAEVAVERATGAVRVRRVVVAHDCGLIVNPDGVRNQIEGNVIQATSRALKEEVRFDATHITSLDWQSYPILTFSEVPEIEVVLIDRPEEKPVGAGEPATVVMAPAIANAIANATGARLRQIPFTPARVRQALAEVG
jgi:CO/xanthine dehydrogenase Mo-binding subunit